MSNSQCHLISFDVALDSLFRIISFSLREGSDTAVDSDFTLHIFQLVQKLFALCLFFFVLLGYLVEFSCALFQLLFHEDKLLFEGDSLSSSLTEFVSLLLQGSVLFLES